MEQRKNRRREPAPAAQIEQLLATHYSQLLKWGTVLTSGDLNKAQEIVQEFCLYFVLTKPNLSEVANLDGYLYTCLRHIYLSGLARASREALHLVSMADFDSFDFAVVANQAGDPLQRQNDLRRICNYTIWRKEQSKSASYFILHFFHGYTRLETAELARLPISAIYNKLKSARTEVRSYLDQSSKLRIIGRNSPPTPRLSWALLSPADLFKELRQTILQTRGGTCLSEEVLLEHYRSLRPDSIPCLLLSHIVSCESCLDIIDRHFRRPALKDREPLDGFGQVSNSSNATIRKSDEASNMAMLHSVRKRWNHIHEHRPQTLSIAVNGKIVAFHDVQGQHSTLSARIEAPAKDQFIEVFSEQDVRLALLSINELPPDGPHELTQCVTLSDSRWLKLNLTFDGLGLNGEVAYFDPALAIEAVEERIEDFARESTSVTTNLIGPPDDEEAETSWVRAAFNRYLRPVVPSSAMAWALVLTIMIGTAGYFGYRRATFPTNAEEVLNRSVRIEMAHLQGQTEHQVIKVEEISANGQTLQQNAIELWKDGDGKRYLRRVYNAQHQLIAVEWKDRSGEHSSRRRGKSNEVSRSTNELLEQDLSASAFKRLGGIESFLINHEGNYELTVAAPVKEHPQLISATLVLDRQLAPIRQINRVRVGREIHELRFIQTVFEWKPSSTVPDNIFEPGSAEAQTDRDQHSSFSATDLLPTSGTDMQLAQLQIAVLYQLNELGVDVGQPIEAIRTPQGHIRVSGAVMDGTMKQKIISHLETLEDHQLLDIQLVVPNDTRRGSPIATPEIAEDTSIYNISQGKPVIDATLRKYFASKGLSGDRLDSSIGQYSQTALQHAQRALQNAYALNRLGSALSATELKSIGLTSQRQWTEMVQKHAFDLEEQLQQLQGQLIELLPQAKDMPKPLRQPIEINNSAQFNSATTQLLGQTQALNNDVGKLFTANPLVVGLSTPDSLLMSSLNAIPLSQAEELTQFAARLTTSEKSAVIGSGQYKR